MNDKNLVANSSVIGFMFGCLIFGFLAIGIASASSAASSTPTTSAVPQSGSFTKKDYAIKGGWTIEQRGDLNVIKFSEDFKTKNGPDLKIFLSPRAFESVRGSNATHKAELIAVLKSNQGGQEYVLPKDVDLSDYRSLLIHCEAFSVTWGGANL